VGRKRFHIPEQAVAEVVVAWLEALGADVYQEVTVSGGVADIVARVGAELWIVEVKTSLSLALIVQAMERRRLAHRVFVAAPHTRNLRDVEMLCRDLGIGMMVVTTGDFDSSWNQPKVAIRCESRRWNRRPVLLSSKLVAEHKTHAKAGAIGAGGRWTPFRNTCERLAEQVRRKPGMTLKEAIAHVEHHYASAAGARSSLAKWIEKGVVAGVQLVKENGRSVLMPAEPQHHAASRGEEEVE
jgi:hypothetical protein